MSSSLGELSPFQIDDQSPPNDPSDQFKNRILVALRFVCLVLYIKLSLLIFSSIQKRLY